jgi:hypothetical protein
MAAGCRSSGVVHPGAIGGASLRNCDAPDEQARTARQQLFRRFASSAEANSAHSAHRLLIMHCSRKSIADPMPALAESGRNQVPQLADRIRASVRRQTRGPLPGRSPSAFRFSGFEPGLRRIRLPRSDGQARRARKT